ncbi:MAG: hypothetical protein EHM28_02270, partial [Spirochaetaceae bacterium]
IREVFDKRVDMVLAWDDFAAIKINWENKSANILEIAKELNLGTGNMVFVDDSAFECHEVRAALFEVLVLELPGEKEKMIPFLKNVWRLDFPRTTAEDAKRSLLYAQEGERKEYKKQFQSHGDFLDSLEMKIDVEKLSKEDVYRASQLTQRVNQFNNTTLRKNENELLSLLDEPGRECRVIRVKDRFGDYGLVGVLLSRIYEKHLHVDAMLLSCRALGKGVEYRMLAETGRIAEASGKSEVVIEFSSSEKNEPARIFLSRFASPEPDGQNKCVFRMESASIRDARFSDITDVAREALDDFEQTSATKEPDQEAGTAAFNNNGNDLNKLAIDIATHSVSATQIHARIREKNMNTGESGRESVPASTPNEKLIMGIWEEIFNMRGLSVHDDFFKLGGDSLKAVLVLSKLQEIFQIELPMHILFEDALTVHELAKTVETYQFADSETGLTNEEYEAIANLSDEEAAALLEREMNKTCAQERPNE